MSEFNETDKMWICRECGGLNASWRSSCGGCDRDKPKKMSKKEYLDKNTVSQRKFETDTTPLDEDEKRMNNINAYGDDDWATPPPCNDYQPPPNKKTTPDKTKWHTLSEELPAYYTPITLELKEGGTVEARRATDGEFNVWTKSNYNKKYDDFFPYKAPHQVYFDGDIARWTYYIL